jgi:hypothetical protein
MRIGQCECFFDLPPVVQWANDYQDSDICAAA